MKLAKLLTLLAMALFMNNRSAFAGDDDTFNDDFAEGGAAAPAEASESSQEATADEDAQSVSKPVVGLEPIEENGPPVKSQDKISDKKIEPKKSTKKVNKNLAENNKKNKKLAKKTEKKKNKKTDKKIKKKKPSAKI